MELILIQHGEAKSEEEDPERPLSDKGRRDAESVAARLASLGISGEVFHSPKLRAKQTAEIFAGRLGSPAREMGGLKPNDEPGTALDFINARASMGKPVILVGHLPHLSRLSCLLLGLEDGAVRFSMGGALCLVREERWKVAWFLTPELAR